MNLYVVPVDGDVVGHSFRVGVLVVGVSFSPFCSSLVISNLVRLLLLVLVLFVGTAGVTGVEGGGGGEGGGVVSRRFKLGFGEVGA